METSEKTIDVLNDLVKINNDRVAGFEKAGEDLENNGNDLQSLFSKLADESRGYSAELSGLARQYADDDSDITEGTSVSGSLHRAWIDVKSTFTGSDRESILDECERGEDAIKDAYKTALEDRDELPYDVVEAISRQQQGIIQGHNLIKALRNQSKAADDNRENNTPENTGTVYTGSVENDSWKNREGGYKPFSSDETSEN